MKLTWLALPLALGAGALAGAQDPAQAQFQAKLVAGRVHLLEGGFGGNIGVQSGPDGLLMIDDQFANLADKIREQLQAIGGAPKFLINTHWHGDHTGGNAAFGREMTILAHENVRQRLSTPQQRAGRPPSAAAPPEALPVITYTDGLTLHFNGEAVRVLHLPGHTDGDSVVLFTESKVAHLGDLFFSGRFPFVDRDSGGDVLALTATVQRLLTELPDDYRIIPGHGPISGKAELREYLRMLESSTALVRERRAQGLSREQAVAAGLPAEWQSWSWPFIDTAAWVGTVYDCLP